MNESQAEEGCAGVQYGWPTLTGAASYWRVECVRTLEICTLADGTKTCILL